MKPKNWNEVEELSEKPIGDILDNYEEELNNRIIGEK